MRRASTLAALLLALATPRVADAFCRTSTCGPGQCVPNPACDSCLEGGLPLFWAGPCVSFTVNSAGSAQRNINYELAHDIILNGFVQWLSVDCGGGGPSIQIHDFGAVSCSKQQYNQDRPNTNVWMFRDASWPYVGTGATLALTTITFNVKTGEIFDADVEINSAQNPLTVTDNNVQADLASIVTHEAGHFLGLSHSCDKSATMFASYKFGEIGLRSLTPDDAAGICAIYPLGASAGKCDPTPRHGFSPTCDEPKESGCCTTAPGRPSRGSDAAILALLIGLSAVVARRRRRRGVPRAADSVKH